MGGEHRADAFNRLDHPAPVVSSGESRFHLAADCIPLCLRNVPGDTAVGQNLDLAVDQLHIDEDAVRLARVGYAQ